MSGPRSLSLIVATTGRAEALERLLRTLAASGSQDFDVLVVDQSTDSTAGLIKGLAQRYGDRLQVQYIRDKGRGLSRARNLGLARAAGEVLGFPDDDCWYPPDVIGRVLDYFSAHPDVGILSGQYTEPGMTNPSFAQQPGDLNAGNLSTRTSSVGTFLNRRALGRTPLRFDERIGAGTDLPAGEETDLLMRLLLAGTSGTYDPTLLVYHMIQRDKALDSESFRALRQAYWYVIGKNYAPPFTTLRMAKGMASCLLKPQRFGKHVCLRAMLDGLRAGREVRRETGAMGDRGQA